MTAGKALRDRHEVIIRAPLKEADSRTTWALSSESLETVVSKLSLVPSILRSFFSELNWVRKVRPDVLYVHDDLSLYVYGTIGKLLRIPTVWHVHLSEGEGIKRRIRDGLCNAKIFVSRHIIGANQKRRWRLIRNSVELAARQRMPKDRVQVLGMLGRVSPLKNQALGIMVLAELRAAGQPLRLEIFGNVLDEDYQRELEALVREKGLEGSVSFRGYVPSISALSEIDVMLSCSTYESFGLAVVEALAAGIPVVASEIEGHREIAALVQSDALSICSPKPVAMAAAVRTARHDGAVVERIGQLFGYERFRDEVLEFFRPFEARRAESVV
jgi:glycosyltransferase involved in cell wall biosynthesis